MVWLKKEGVKIYLHCFSYGRAPSKELEELCEKVYYYPRKTGLFANFSSLPYTVKSRQSAELEKNLLANDFPILFEVLHTCYLMNDVRFKDRVKIYRHSNIEHVYYAHLAKSEKNPVKKIYLQVEAKKLRRFENIISNADYILAVNEKDANYFRKTYSKTKTIYLPSFHSNSEIEIKTGKSDYILYHGNLSVSENYEAAAWLIDNVFSQITDKVIIAGLNPPGFLIAKIARYNNIQLIANPSNEKMDDLLENAQVHSLHTHQDTGLKLKLLNVLYKGRFILCNAFMLEGTGITGGNGLFICNSKNEYREKIQLLMNREFTNDLVSERAQITARFDNAANAKLLASIL